MSFEMRRKLFMGLFTVAAFASVIVMLGVEGGLRNDTLTTSEGIKWAAGALAVFAGSCYALSQY